MTGAPFEPDVAAALERMREAGRPAFETLSVEEARAVYRGGRDTVHLPSIPVDAVEPWTLAGRPARRYRIATGVGTILFAHGGGYVIGDLDTHDAICRRLAVAAGADIVAVDYRLAPEHPFPAAFTDVFAAYADLLERHAGPVALAGDSAGGALCLAAAIGARDAGLAIPKALALFYPVADIGAETPSYFRVTGVPITAATMRWFWRHYVGDNAAASRDWRASPLRAPSLAELPPTFLSSAGHDPLHDEAALLVDRLRGCGVTVEHRDLPGQIHGYLTLGRLIGEAARSIAAAGAFLSAHLRS